MKKGKIIILAISILVTILATTFVGVYSYNRYDPDVDENYLSEFKSKELLPGLITTEQRIDYYRKFNNYYYEKEPVLSQEIKDEKTGEVICVLDIYRTLTQNQNSETKEMEYIIKYEMFAHQVNYTYLKNAFKGTIDDEDIIFKKNNPALVVNFYPTAELKSEEALLNNTEAVLDNNGKLKTGIAIYDYKSNPEKDGENPYLVQLNYFRETNLTDSKALFDDKAYVAVTAQLPITVQEDGYDADYTKTLNYNLFEGEIENFVLKGTELNKEDMQEGIFGNSTREKYAKVGYNSWVIKRYVWWQALIALVVSGLIMTGFYAAFTYEEPQPKKKGKRK